MTSAVLDKKKHAINDTLLAVGVYHPPETNPEKEPKQKVRPTKQENKQETPGKRPPMNESPTWYMYHRFYGWSENACR